MITLKNVKTLRGEIENVAIEAEKEETIDAQGKLTLLPGLIDAHVHFRVPGQDYKEDWKSGAAAAIAGGVTTVFDMPNNEPPCVDLESLKAKKAVIDKQLAEAGIPLHYRLYIGADKDHMEQIGTAKDQAVAIKVFMGSSTGGLVMDKERDLDRIFQLAAQHNMVIAVHAEDEGIIKDNKIRFEKDNTPSVHSKIRSREAAVKATKQAISLAEKHGTQLYILHVSTKEELDLIRQAKKKQLLVYAETTPHHLLLSEEDYAEWGTLVQVNPSLKTKQDQEALWEALHDRTIDSIGSDHAPHTIEEKKRPYGQAPSGIPGVETTLPLLLNAVNEGRLSLEEVVNLTRINLEYIYSLDRQRDFVLVDMEKEKELKNEELKTKCGWSPYAGRVLKGWPAYTILNGNLFKVG